MGVLRALGDLVIPDVGQFKDLASEIDGRGSQVAWSVLDETVLNLSELDEVASHHVGLLVNIHELGEPLKEQVGTGEGDVEVEFLEHLAFHLQDLLLGVGLVGHVDKVSEIWWVDLLVLAGGEEGSDTNELQLLPTHLGSFEVTVDEVNGQEKRFVDQLELITISAAP